MDLTSCWLALGTCVVVIIITLVVAGRKSNDRIPTHAEIF